MDFLGIGPLELLFIMVIALIVLGPRDIVRFARSAGRALNRIYRSEAWGTINKASREFRDLPNRLAREAALDELDESIRSAGKSKKTGEEQAEADSLDAWKPSPKSEPDAEAEASPSSDQTEAAGEPAPQEPAAEPPPPAAAEEEQDD